MTVTAEELHRRAVELSIAGRFAPARRALEAAAARTDEPDLRARIDGTRAYILATQGAPGEAEDLCRRALAADGLTPGTVAILAGQMGLLALHGGRYDEAVSWLATAIHGLEDDDIARARNLLNRGVAHMQLRHLEDAAEDLGLAAELFAAGGMAMESARAEHNRGYVALLEGDLVTALNAMVTARPDAASTPVGEAIGDLDRAEVLRDAGLAAEAESVLAHVAETFGSNRMRQMRAEAEFQLARSLLSHDPARARSTAAAAARRFRALGNDTWAARAEGIRLRAALLSRRTEPGVRPPAPGRVADVARELERRGFRNEGLALALTADIDRSIGGAAPSGPIRTPKGASLEVHLLADRLRSARAASRGHESDARRFAARGLDTLTGWQRSFGCLDLQTSAGLYGTDLVMAGLRSAVEDGSPETVFEWSERARHLSQQVVPLRPPPDPELAEDLAQLRIIRADNPAGDWLADPRAEALRERARQRQWTSTRTAGVIERVALSDVQRALDADTAYLGYVFSGDSLVVLVVTADAARVHRLEAGPRIDAIIAGLRSDLDMWATVRTGPMAPVVARSLDARLAGLSAVLVDDALAKVGARRIVVTVPGILNGIPWTMLPGLAGRAVTVAASATRWTGWQRAGRAAHRTAGFAAGPRVARAVEEVTAAARSWPASRILDGDAAHVAAVTGLAAEVDVLHVAAHGRHAVDNPLFSGLELADGTLFGYDVDLIARPPRTVVLSACEVGRSSVRWGEEAVGMTRVWLHAGVRSVIAAPVTVADDLASELLGALHGGLSAGLAPAEALAAASERTGIRAPFQTHGAGL